MLFVRETHAVDNLITNLRKEPIIVQTEDIPSSSSLTHIDFALEVLQSKRNVLEHRDVKTSLQLFQNFLSETKVEKLLVRLNLTKALEKLKKEIDIITKDYDAVRTEMSQIQNSESKLQESPSTARVPDKITIPKKRSFDEAEQTFPTSSYIPQTSADIAKLQTRLSIHKQDLQSKYFDWRSGARKSDFIEEHLSFAESLFQCSRFSKFKVISNLFFADNFSGASASIISSIEFDKDDEFFALAGVMKKIRIFDFNSSITKPWESSSNFITKAKGLFSNLNSSSSFQPVPTTYPVLELPTHTKISCLSWSSFNKSDLVGADYEGVMSLWDSIAGTCLRRYDEHEKRAWSVHFNDVNPTQFASGGDDNRVKIWSSRDPHSVDTIEIRANVCSVRYHPTFAHQLAIGSADHALHFYDLRKSSEPTHSIKGHRRAVSFVKFVDRDHVVTASTDSTLKLWSIKDSIAGTRSCKKTFTGHQNDKHFVGLSVNSTGDFIATGCETNQVFAYHRDLSSPVSSIHFGYNADAVTVSISLTQGREVQQEDSSLFVSSVCWARKTPNILISANAQGSCRFNLVV